MKVYDSPAKVNLNLRVLGRRDDGFHEVETLMAPLKLKDQLSFEKAERLALECSYSGVPLGESNLVTKAVRLLERQTDKEFFYKMKIEKSIPHGAGLAGGSSNAASTLMALNELEQLGFSESELMQLGGQLGADVAFFIHRKCCLCRGKGEIVTPVELELDLDVLLVKPDFSVSTPAAYSAWQSSHEIKGIDYSAQSMAWGEMVNDLERPVFEKYRFLAELKMWLLARPEVTGAMMSGSGSAVFAITTGETQSLVKQMHETLDPKLWVKKTRILL